ncbi:hypothetical protein IQ254_01190 [Nodosilinea sp. LEGE 07088]|uniref:hypothetical protein n=1 Tax=Nodosilinea sp. LEGE 07088 TaxID=2777968 RepID=UPI00187EFE56|nr:hypothetical protein [Nodosilinea sp. LEGE 07088]MBE9135832.1 hypothetical protein [Nodosilinea sp. LEGE 07088]
MLTLRTLRHVATSRSIPSIRSVPSHSQGDCLRSADRGRMGYQQRLVQLEEVRRQWLQQQWQNRF